MELVFLIAKAALVWLGISCLAVVNGVMREKLIAPSFGKRVALPLSGLSLALIVFLLTYLLIGFLGIYNSPIYFLIGLQWVVMTLAFEFLFGHYGEGKSWQSLMQTFNILKGDLFILVLVVTFLSPYFAARLKGWI